MGKRAVTVLVLFYFTCGVLAGCATKARTGAGVGSLAGGLAGALSGKGNDRYKNAGIGIVAGGLIGYLIGNEMDKYDRDQITRIYEKGQSGYAQEWVNPDSGNRYAMTPQPAVREADGRVCRDAEILAVVDGKAEKTIATACRMPDGRWQIQN